jgi:uncharacterized protein (DUF2062 family)
LLWAPAIGVLLGFTPLFGLKTLLALLLAAPFRVNKISAVVAVSLHDLLLPFWPVVLRVEFDIGSWLLHEPHQWPLPFDIHRLDYHVWLHWKHFAAIGGPTLLGSVILGVPAGLAVYWLLKRVLIRRQQRHAEANMLVQAHLNK